MTIQNIGSLDVPPTVAPLDLTGVPAPDAVDMRITLADQRATIAEQQAIIAGKDTEIAQLTAELTARKWARDVRLFPLGARRVLAWIGIFFLFIAALAILGSIVGPAK